MSTQTWQIIYWVSTGLFSFAMAAAATQYFTSAKMKETFAHLGFPSYFRVELALAKYAGVLALLLPVPLLLKEWAYAGFAIVLASALVAHIAKKDPAGAMAGPIVMGIVFAVSYYAFHMLNLVL